MSIDGESEGVVIVGAGQAAADLTGALRQNGYGGPVTLIGDELYVPYRRPPLTKGYLVGETALDGLYIRSAKSYADQSIVCRFGIGVESIDPMRRKIRLFDGSDVAYRHLVIATGGRPRRIALSGSTHSNVHHVRTINDIDRLKTQLLPGKRLMIIGGGFIGLEAASVAQTMGLKVTLVETSDRVLARVVSPELSSFYENAHRARGVRIRTGIGVHSFEGDAVVDHVVMSDGERMSVDLVIVGIGLIPNTELAAAANLDVANGILTDTAARTSDPHIYAIGDCACYQNAFLERRVRLESVPNATEQARNCAAAICGQLLPAPAAPWFWSDQYDLKLQMVGLSEGYDCIAIRGDMQQQSFAIFYLMEGVIVSAHVVNRPAEFLAARRLVTQRVRASPGQLTNNSVALATLVAATQ